MSQPRDDPQDRCVCGHARSAHETRECLANAGTGPRRVVCWCPGFRLAERYRSRVLCVCGHLRAEHSGACLVGGWNENRPRCYCPNFRPVQSDAERAEGILAAARGPQIGLSSVGVFYTTGADGAPVALDAAYQCEAEAAFQVDRERRAEAAETLRLLAQVGRAIALIFESDTGTTLRGALLELD